MSMTDERVKKVRGVRAVEYHSAVKKKESLLFAVTWMELEGVMLSEVSQPEKDDYTMVSLTCGT